jgi:hypothetical protein
MVKAAATTGISMFTRTTTVLITAKMELLTSTPLLAAQVARVGVV